MPSYEYDDDYATCFETHSTLRIFSDVCRTDEISAVLELRPTTFFSKGDTFGINKLRRKANGWFYSTKGLVSSKDTRRHLDTILSAIHDKKDAFDQLAEKGCKTDIVSFWVSGGQGGPAIEPEQMAVLAQLKISVWWDVYFHDAESDVPNVQAVS